MKKIAVAMLLVSGMAFSAAANADKHTLSLGYAHSKVQDYKHLKGVNLKYRHESDSSFGIISSFTYMGAKEHTTEDLLGDLFKEDSKLKYYSLAAGPAWRINDYVSLYGLMGINYNKFDYHQHWDGVNNSYSHNKASFMYGAGVQVHVTKNIAVDVGYEGSHAKMFDKKHNIHGYNIGLGYSF